MKRLIIYIITSLLCLLNQATFAVESNVVTNQNTVSSLEDHNKEDFVPFNSTSLLDIQKSDDVEMSLIPNNLGSWPMLGEEPSINYYFKTPPINNKNNFYYEGSYELKVPLELIHVLDSVTSMDSLYTVLEEIQSTYVEYTNTKMYEFKYEQKRFQREKRLEAIVYLVWPFTAIISLLFILIYYDNEKISHPLTLYLIAAIVMTFITFPNILMLLNGVEYSVINALGK